MAQGNQVAGAFGSHHAGEASGLENGAFFAGDLAVGDEHCEGARQHDGRHGMGGAVGGGLGADVDHRGLIFRVYMGEHGGS